MNIGDIVKHVLAPSLEPVTGLVVGIRKMEDQTTYGIQWADHSGLPSRFEWHYDMELVVLRTPLP